MVRVYWTVQTEDFVETTIRACSFMDLSWLTPQPACSSDYIIEGSKRDEEILAVFVIGQLLMNSFQSFAFVCGVNAQEPSVLS